MTEALELQLKNILVKNGKRDAGVLNLMLVPLPGELSELEKSIYEIHDAIIDYYEMC